MTGELPAVQVEGGVNVANVTEVKTKKRQLRHSNYFITINTNKRFTGHEPHFNRRTREFEKAITDTFADEVGDIVVFKEGGPADIKSINLEYGIELGDELGCLHVHLTLKISHYAKLKLDYAAIRAKMLEKLPFLEGKPVHMSNRLYRDAGGTLRDYMNKNKAASGASGAK